MDLFAAGVILALSLVVAAAAARGALAFMFYLMMRPTPVFHRRVTTTGTVHPPKPVLPAL
jgi:hypothetical protein